MQTPAIGLLKLNPVARNISSNYAVVAVNGIAAFVLTPILFRYLHSDRFSVLVFGITLTGVLSTLDLGLTTSLVRFVGGSIGQDQLQEVRRLGSTVFLILLVLGFLFTVGIVALTPLIARFFQVRANTIPLQATIGIIGLGVIFDQPSAAVRAVLDGAQDFHLANTVEIATQILRFLAILFLIHWNAGLLSIAAVFPSLAFLRLAGMLAMARRGSMPFQPHWGAVEASSVRPLTEFTMLAFSENAFTQLFNQADTFLAAHFLPLPALATLNIARRFPMALARFVRPAVWVAYPMIAAASKGDSHPFLRYYLCSSSKATLFLCLPLAAWLFVWANPILRLWIGSELVDGVAVLRIFSVLAVFFALQECHLTFLFGIGRIRFSAGLSLFMLIAGIAAGAWASQRFGLAGLALAFTVIQAFGTLLLFQCALREAGLNLGKWLQVSIIGPAIALLPTVAWDYLSYRWTPNTWFRLFMSLSIGGLIYLSVLTGLTDISFRSPWRQALYRLFFEVPPEN